MYIILGIALILLISFLILNKKTKKSLRDRKLFDEYVKIKGYSLEEQRDLCERFGLTHQIGRRSYNSVEEWEKDLTIIWSGDSSPIEFTYQNHDERERRTVTPTEFGFDGNKNLYIRGMCHSANEQRTFRTSRIETKIKIDDRKLNLNEWVKDVLDIDPQTLVNDFGLEI